MFETKKVFWLSIVGLVFFSFFSGVDTSLPAKMVSIIVAITLVFLYWSPFKKILRFSEGHKSEFEVPFLKKLRFSRYFIFKNKSKEEKIFRSWNSFWSEKSDINERIYTDIFIAHIDDALKFKKYDLAINLGQAYINNIDKRERFSIGYEILPKAFAWHEVLWEQHQHRMNFYDIEKSISHLISKKHFPTFTRWIIQGYKYQNSEIDRFWNWHYFGAEFFQVIIKTLLKERHEPHELLSSFKKYVEQCEKKLETITDEKEKEAYWSYINELFSSFCPTFYSNIADAPSNYDIWAHYFPPEWKVTAVNKDNRIAHVVLREFYNWSRDRMFKHENKGEHDKDLTEVINGIFPNIHSSLFRAFLMLFYSGNVKYALDMESNFYIVGTSILWSGSSEESDEERDRRIEEMMNAKNISQKEETIQIILKFFNFWQALTIYKDDLTKVQSNRWQTYSVKQRNLIVKNVRKSKLEKIKTELNSEEIIKFCLGAKQKELYRVHLLKLVELLILEISK